MIKNELKEFLSELKKFKVQPVLVLDYEKGNHHKILHSNAKLTANDSDTDEAFKPMRQNIMTKVKNYAREDWIVLDLIIKHSIKIFEC